MRDRIALELVCEFSFGHLVLLASKVTKQGVYKSRGYSHKELEDLITAHDPKTHPSVLFDQFVDRMFARAQQYNPTLVRKVYKIALEHSDRLSDMDAAGDSLLPLIKKAIARDETGGFKTLSNEEMIFLFRGLLTIIRSPMMEKNPFFGTPAHIRLAKTYVRKMLLNER